MQNRVYIAPGALCVIWPGTAIALTDQRILAMDEDRVRLAYRDYRDHARSRALHLSAEEPIRRFLLQVLPKGLMRIRHFGFLANRCRARRIAQIRKAIDAQAAPMLPEADLPTFDGYPGPACRIGRPHIIARPAPQRDDAG